MESKFGSMGHFTRATGKMIKLTEGVASFMLMVMSTMETGKTTKPMAMESTTTLMVPDTRVGGSRTNNTVKAKRSGQIMRAMKVSTKMARSMGMVNSFGPMAQPTPVIL